jgi:cysteine desulfurase
MQRVCFDHISGTPMEPAVLEAMRPWFSEQRFAGTGAVHSGGVEARTAIDEAREKVARLINAASPEEIIFTSSGTEAINLAIKGCALADRKRGNDLVFSAIDHPAVTQSIEFLEPQGFNGICANVTKDGSVVSGEIASFTRDKVILVCTHAGNHDIGVIQDLGAIADAADKLGAAFFVDATYAAGWMPIDVQAINASYVAIAPHRFGGPKGVGILYKQRRARLTPMIHGGAQELGWRAGTENIPGIIGAGVACELATEKMTERTASAAKLQAKMWTGISKAVRDVRLNGPVPGPKRLPNTLNLSIAGLEGEGLALSLDMKGFAITSGQACTTKAAKVPPTLAAIHVPENYAVGTVIASFGPENTADEADQFLAAFPAVVEKLRALEGKL